MKNRTSRTSGNVNRATLTITSDGKLPFQMWDNAGSQCPSGSVLQFAPTMDDFAGTHMSHADAPGSART